MDVEVERLEEQIRALLPRGWELMHVGPVDDLPEPDWGDLDGDTIARIRADLAQARVMYGWGAPSTIGAGSAAGRDRLSAARAALAQVGRSILRPGEPGALDARIQVTPTDLQGLPADLADLDVAPGGTWAATSLGDDPELVTRDGIRLRVSGAWPSVAWMGTHLVTLEGDRDTVLVVRTRDGTPIATWLCWWDVAAGSDWIAAADSGDDPNDDMLQRLVASADRTVRRTWRRWAEDAVVLRLPPDGLALVADDAEGEGSAMFLFDTVDADARVVPMPLMWTSQQYDGPAPAALGGDRFALLRRDASGRGARVTPR